MTLKDDLIAARALIQNPDDWKHGYDLRDGSMCALRAIEAITGKTAYHEIPAYAALCRALPKGWVKKYGRESVGVYNDQSAHSDVLALFDRAINACEAA